MEKKITQEFLKKTFDYKDGFLYRKTASGTAKIGDVAGCLRKDGYYVTNVFNKLRYVHRLVYCWHTGEMPELIDHKDTNPSNNKIENLRPADHPKNHFNQSARSDNCSGHKNVYWSKAEKKWKVQVTFRGNKISGGTFSSLEDAIKSATDLRNKLHGEFVNHG